ncbi:hypothetical protein FRX31_008036 [Thalictrum thalictroides]|uniref:Uncharacterized protein n=1 Tax=Thalictrum thalictroides TaxID=46969 RepID=A0A7J6WY56_THATH|nr:hypothetical protein FRX31_008036 [Thalictrum thalictroides]
MNNKVYVQVAEVEELRVLLQVLNLEKDLVGSGRMSQRRLPGEVLALKYERQKVWKVSMTLQSDEAKSNGLVFPMYDVSILREGSSSSSNVWPKQQKLAEIEESSQSDGHVRIGIMCDNCLMDPIVGKRYKCKDCWEERTRTERGELTLEAHRACVNVSCSLSLYLMQSILLSWKLGTFVELENVSGANLDRCPKTKSKGVSFSLHRTFYHIRRKKYTADFVTVVHQEAIQMQDCWDEHVAGTGGGIELVRSSSCLCQGCSPSLHLMQFR